MTETPRNRTQELHQVEQRGYKKEIKAAARKETMKLFKPAQNPRNTTQKMNGR